MKIAVAGTGYVGLSIATLLAQSHTVYAVDIIPEKVALINSRKSPIQDEYIEKYLAEKELDLTATLDWEAAYREADFVVIAAPTNYDSKKNFFDTSAVESVIRQVMSVNPDAIMVIKSTIPVGFTRNIREKTGSKNILFSPEFLRESKALYDNLYPSRIIVGTDMEDPRLLEAAHTFAALLQEGALKPDVDTLFMGFIHGIFFVPSGGKAGGPVSLSEGQALAAACGLGQPDGPLRQTGQNRRRRCRESAAGQPPGGADAPLWHHRVKRIRGMHDGRNGL